jgi:hypothetical protein
MTMRMTLKLLPTAACALLVVLVSDGCTGKTNDSGSSNATADVTSRTIPGSAMTATATDDNAPLYPAWAKAAAPPYPNVTVGVLVNTKLYQFQSPDDVDTVVNW